MTYRRSSPPTLDGGWQRWTFDEFQKLERFLRRLVPASDLPPTPEPFDLALVASGSAVWDPANTSNNASVGINVTATGAILGDFAIASFDGFVLANSWTVEAAVTAANTVRVQLVNRSGVSQNLNAGTVRVRVYRPRAP